MPVQDLGDWLDEQAAQADFWWVKRLSANDTQATGGHQAGPLIPKDIMFGFLPALDDATCLNPKRTVAAYIDSHSQALEVVATWYNNSVVEGPPKKRNETRLTKWGGSSSPMLDPESTGALVVFRSIALPGINLPHVIFGSAMTTQMKTRSLSLLALWNRASDAVGQRLELVGLTYLLVSSPPRICQRYG